MVRYLTMNGGWRAFGLRYLRPNGERAIEAVRIEAVRIEAVRGEVSNHERLTGKHSAFDTSGRTENEQ